MGTQILIQPPNTLQLTPITLTGQETPQTILKKFRAVLPPLQNANFENSKETKSFNNFNSFDYTFQCESEELTPADFLNATTLHRLHNKIISVALPVLGGKGGFGSLLRIAAAQKKHFNNFDSARDQNGRRLRDIKNEQRLKEWVRKKRKEEAFLKEENELMAK